MIDFHLDAHSGAPPYVQIAQQVRQALRVGMLRVGDQLPTVREVVEKLVINPNTVLKAYRELEHEGLVVSRPGQGTFVLRSLAGEGLASHAALRRSLTQWLRSAYNAGLDEESVLALFQTTFHQTPREQQAGEEDTA